MLLNTYNLIIRTSIKVVNTLLSIKEDVDIIIAMVGIIVIKLNLFDILTVKDQTPSPQTHTMEDGRILVLISN